MLLHVTSVSHREYVRSLYSHPPEIKVYHGRPPYPPARGSALCTPELTARKQSTILDKSHAKITQEYNKLEGKKDAAARCARKNRRRSGHCRRAKAEPPAFPNMALLDNHDLLVVYRVGTDHHRTWDGDLVSRRSSGHGKTGPTRNRFCLTQGATSPRRKASFSYLTVACCYGLSNSGRVGARTPLQPLQR